MRVVRSTLSLLPFIAIIFAATYFFRIETPLEIRQLDVLLLSLSFILLIIVFFFQSVIWYRLLLRFGVNVNFEVAFISQFRSTLMKYIPGKIWTIVGRANIVSQHGYSFEYCSFVSSFMQLLNIVSGLIVGVFGVLFFRKFFLPPYMLFILIVVLILSLLLFTRELLIPHFNSRFVPRVIQSLGGQKIPPVTSIILFCMVHWILMGCAFFLFIRCITLDVDLSPILLQPLANNIGIIFSFAPGGLGVREGIMVGYLCLGGLSATAATGISIAARLWFWAGELVIFIMGWVVQKRPKQIVSGADEG